MKKLYLFLFTVLCFAFVSKAERTYKFNFTVEDPESVTIKVCDYDDASKVLQEFEVKEGLNTYEFTSVNGANMYINTVEGKILKIHKADGTVEYDVKDNALKITLSSFDYGWGSPSEYTYTIKTFNEATFRPHTLNITLDNPEGINLNIRGIGDIKPDKTEYEIPYNEDYEDMLTVRTSDYESPIYKVTANGEEVHKENLYYNIPLVDRSDIDDIKYITNVVITKDFPEDMMCTVKLIYTNGDPGCIKSVTYNDVPVTDFANEEGFQVHAGKKLLVEFNKDDYNTIAYQRNDETPNESSYGYTEVTQYIDSDFMLTVTSIKYQYYEATIVIEDPDAIKVTTTSYPYPEYSITAGENIISFSDKMYGNEIYVSARDGFEISRIYNKTTGEDVKINSYGPNTTLYLKDKEIYEIYADQIIRDNNLVFYIDDITPIWDDYVTISRGGVALKAVPGYYVVDFREKDGMISINAWGAPSEAKFYRNYELMDVSYYSSVSFTNPQNNEVIKLFYVPENAIEHTVTFDMNEGALDGYEVKKDILAAVDPTQPVSAVGKTQFTIAPISREGSDLTVTVGDKKVEPVDGVYTFETEGDTTVKVTKATSGIENVICGENGTADVYNLQGIRVARQAKAADVNALPAGIYVVNGQKVIVK